ncbi:MAG: Sec-independent protein translocase subunit TatA [Pseudonocardia sp.]|nr:Sec-independent protein translocase subunit TatA [Pseudonocardia sp.]
MPGGYEWIIIVGVLLLLFGAKKLPDMARSIGQSARVFKGEMKGLKDDEGPADGAKADGAKPAGDTTPAATPTQAQALPASTTRTTRTTNPTSGESTQQAQPGRSTDAT